MNLCFVLANPELGGGVKVVFQLAHLATSMGHAVEVHAIGPRPAWTLRYQCHYRDREEGLHLRRPYEVVFATYYTTVPEAERMDARRVVHFCQGFEGDLEHLAVERASIEEAYARPHAVMTVNPALGRHLQREFGKRWCFVPPPLDDHFRPLPVWQSWFRPKRQVRIMIPGVFEAEVKGVRHAIACVERLRKAGHRVHTVRVSTFAQSAEERGLHVADEFLHAVPPERVASALRQCDLLLLGSGPGEGFGLPALEAAAAGVPAVAFDLPAMRLAGIERKYRVPLGDVDAMANAASNLISNRAQWRQVRERQLMRVRRRFSPASCARRLARALDFFVSPQP
jgi:glycosyltransferase involved in cell wall biosynthesis